MDETGVLWMCISKYHGYIDNRSSEERCDGLEPRQAQTDKRKNFKRRSLILFNRRKNMSVAATSVSSEYHVADISLADWGHKEIRIAVT